MEYVSAHGVEVPILGLGTAGMTGERYREAVTAGLNLGHRHLDTAQMYDNEDAVGDAIDASSVAREEMFLTTKLNRGSVGYDAALNSFEASLKRLGTDYVDLLLIHAPSRTVPVEETLEAMNQLHEGGNSPTPRSEQLQRRSITGGDQRLDRADSHQSGQVSSVSRSIRLTGILHRKRVHPHGV